MGEPITLHVEDPNMRSRNSPGYSLTMPAELSQESYDLLVWNLEFRRRCMNQGFDNLLELLKKHWETYRQLQEPQPADPTPQPERA
jgi:hypothetical protein